MSAVLSPRSATLEHAERSAVGAPLTSAEPLIPAGSPAGERPAAAEREERFVPRRRSRAQAQERRALRAERQRARQEAETLMLLVRSGLHHLR